MTCLPPYLKPAAPYPAMAWQRCLIDHLTSCFVRLLAFLSGVAEPSSEKAEILPEQRQDRLRTKRIEAVIKHPQAEIHNDLNA